MLAVATPASQAGTPDIPERFREAVQLEWETVNTRLNPLHALAAMVANKPYIVSRFYSDDFALRLEKLLQEQTFDAIQLEHLCLGLYLPVLRRFSRAPVVLRPQNVEHRVWERYRRQETGWFINRYLATETRKLRDFEIRLAGKVDAIMAISDEDAEFFRICAPASTRVITLPAGFDFGLLSSLDPERSYSHFPQFYHLGSMDWRPNIQGIKWFLRYILPVVTRRNPDFVLRLAGKQMPQWLYRRQGQNLVVDGEVEDAMRYLEDKSVLVAPLLAGSGMRIKIVEAMALGKTVIATTAAAEGIACIGGKHILLADTPAEFAQCISRCSESAGLCREIGNNAQQFARENFDIRSIGEKMAGFYREIVPSPSQ